MSELYTTVQNSGETVTAVSKRREAAGYGDRVVRVTITLPVRDDANVTTKRLRELEAMVRGFILGLASSWITMSAGTVEISHERVVERTTFEV